MAIIKYLLQNKTNVLFTTNGIAKKLDTTTPTEDLFNEQGFDDITLLNSTTFNGQVEMQSEGVLGNGNLFSYEIDTSLIKNIN